MFRKFLIASALAASCVSVSAGAQQTSAVISGTRLDVVATGEVTRVPDIATIGSGVVTQAPTATEAIAKNAEQMESMRAALRRAGVAERDIQTSSISLQGEWRYAENQPPQFIGYRASNQVSVRFRDVANAGRILDALVAAGANQIDGPTLSLDRPQAALDEARTAALTIARARADLYARALGMRVKRILSVSESGATYAPMQRQMMAQDAQEAIAVSRIDPGEQVVSVGLTVSFELE